MLSEYGLLQLKELLVDPTDKDSDIKPEHIQELAKYLHDHSQDGTLFPDEKDDEDEVYRDVRVIWNPAKEEPHFTDPPVGFQYRFGDSQYDTDGRGLCAHGAISYGMDEESLMEVAKEMLTELVDSGFW